MWYYIKHETITRVYAWFRGGIASTSRIGTSSLDSENHGDSRYARTRNSSSATALGTAQAVILPILTITASIIMLFSPLVAEASLTTNIIGYWDLNGNSNDDTGNGFNGADTSVTYSSGNGIIPQGAGYTNSPQSKIVVTDAASLKPTGNWTLNGWIKTSDTTNGPAIFQSFSQNTKVAGLRCYISGTHTFILSGKNTGTTNGTDYKFVAGAATITDGNWHMVTCEWNGSNLLIYVDGNSTPDATVAWANASGYAATNYVQIGALNDSGTSNEFGTKDLDEIGFWSRALSTSEISQLYNGGAGLTYPFTVAATTVYVPLFPLFFGQW